ncbi:MAG TPA: tetratricopeptide repeat protein, partial [Bryobacteraceae bacterium]|nr:tetratricopeptide repeat protein [Bryobacteraceae bacterium]
VAAVNPLEKTYSTNRDLLFVLGMSMIRAGQLSEGVQRIQKIAESSNAADMYLIVARTYLQLSDHERAGVAVQAAMRLKPDLPGLLTVRGMWMEKIGDHEGAAAILEKALVENTDDFQAHLHLGAIRYVQRDLPAARKHLTRALQLDSISPLARYEMALVERAEGNLQAAVAHLEEVVKGTPKWLQPHIELAALYYRVKRPADGARERAIVDKLSSEEHTQELESLGIKQ